MVGLKDDTAGLDFDKIKDQLIDMQKRLPSFKLKVQSLTLERMKQDQEEERQAAKWRSMNMGIEQWKKKYLFPFGDITSVASTEASSAYMTTPAPNKNRASPFRLNQSSQL